MSPGAASAAGWADASACGRQGLVPADSERRYAAAQVARLTIGNASAVEVEHQGRKLDLGGFSRANVARFTVSSDGSFVAAD